MKDPTPRWQMVELGQLAEDLRDEDTTSRTVLGVLWRLLDEVEQLGAEVDDLWGERR